MIDCTAVLDILENVIPNQIRTNVFRNRIEKHVDKYLEPRKAGEALGNRMLHNDDFLATITSYALGKGLKAIANQGRTETLRATCMAITTHRSAAVAAEAKLGQKHLLVQVEEVVERRKTTVISHNKHAITL